MGTAFNCVAVFHTVSLQDTIKPHCSGAGCRNVEGYLVNSSNTELVLHNVRSESGHFTQPLKLAAGITCTLKIIGTNYLTADGPNMAGIEIPASSKLVVIGDGTLTIEGNGRGAEIGGSGGKDATMGDCKYPANDWTKHGGYDKFTDDYIRQHMAGCKGSDGSTTTDCECSYRHCLCEKPDNGYKGNNGTDGQSMGTIILDTSFSGTITSTYWIGGGKGGNGGNGGNGGSASAWVAVDGGRGGFGGNGGKGGNGGILKVYNGTLNVQMISGGNSGDGGNGGVGGAESRALSTIKDGNGGNGGDVYAGGHPTDVAIYGGTLKIQSIISGATGTVGAPPQSGNYANTKRGGNYYWGNDSDEKGKMGKVQSIGESVAKIVVTGGNAKISGTKYKTPVNNKNTQLVGVSYYVGMPGSPAVKEVKDIKINGVTVVKDKFIEASSATGDSISIMNLKSANDTTVTLWLPRNTSITDTVTILMSSGATQCDEEIYRFVASRAGAAGTITRATPILATMNLLNVRYIRPHLVLGDTVVPKECGASARLLNYEYNANSVCGVSNGSKTLKWRTTTRNNFPRDTAFEFWDSVVLTRPDTFTAMCGDATMRLKYDRTGNSKGNQPLYSFLRKVTYGTAIPTITLASPTVCNGYKFNGFWDLVNDEGYARDGATRYINPDGTSAYNWTLPIMPNGGNGTPNIEASTYPAYAAWVPDTTTVRLDSSGIIIGSIEAVYGQEVPNITNTLQKTGYTFTGFWDTTSNIQYIDGNGQSSNIIWNNCSALDTLYAQWTENIYTITYDIGAGDGISPPDTNVYYTTVVRLPNYTGTRSGYKFNGWATSPAERGDTVGHPVSRLSSINGATVTMYAAWLPDTTKLSFVNNNNSSITVNDGQTSILSAKYGDTVPPLTGGVPSASGGTARFVGYWDTDIHNASGDLLNSGKMYYDADGKAVRTWDKYGANHSLYSRWSNILYHIRFFVKRNLDDPELDNSPKDDSPALISPVYYGTGVLLPFYGGYKYGYDFVGWTLDEFPTLGSSTIYSCGTYVYNLTYVNNVYVYLFGVWKPIEGIICVDCYAPGQDPGGSYSSGKSGISRASGAADNDNLPIKFNVSYGQDMGDVAHNIVPKVKTGYTFEGYFAGDGAMYFDANARSVKQYWTDTVRYLPLYSHWQANRYGVTYNVQGGTQDAPQGHTDVQYDAGIVLQTYTGSKYGYTFLGWSLSPDGAGQIYAAGSTVSNLSATNGDAVILYAVWQPTSTMAAFDANGGAGGQAGTAPVFVRYASSMPTLNAVWQPIYRRGYEFLGYGDAEGTLYYDSTYSSVRNWDKADANYTLYAQWKMCTYSIQYNLAGGSGTAPAGHTGVRYDSTLVLREYAGTKYGYTFDGWSPSAGNKTASYAAGAGAEGIGDAGEAVTLYAVWKPKTSQVRYDANGGAFPINEILVQTAEYAAAMPLFVIYPNRVGYDFAGFSDAPVDGIQYYNEYGTSIKNWDKEDAEATMYTLWRPRTTELQYNANGGIGGPTGSQTVSYDGEMPVLETLPVRIGYVFQGFYDNATEGVEYYDSTGVGIKVWDNTARTATLYAHWRAKTTILDFDNTGGIGGDAGSKIAVFDDLMPNIETPPMRDGYVLLGYFDSDGTQYYEGMYPILGWNQDVARKTLYAVWVGSEYSITYKNVPAGLIEPLPSAYQTAVGLELPQARHNQYIFAGYYLDSTMESEVTHISLADTGNMVLYTKWTYTVEYDKNGGTGTDISSDVLLYNGTGAIAAVPADWERGGYEVLGWSTDAGATTAMIPREGGAAAGLPANKVVRLYAVWNAGSSRVILSMGENVGGFAQSNPEVTAVYGNAMPKLAEVPQRTGYLFAGYYDALEGGTLYYTSAGASARTWDKMAGTVTLYARWEYDNSANLLGLLVNNGSLYPSFAANVYEYNLALPCGEDATLTLSYANDNTAVKINGTVAQASKINETAVQASYVVGTNPSYETLQIEVSTAGKTPKTYTVKLNVPLSSRNILYTPEVSPGRMEVRDAVYDSYQWYEDGTLLSGATGAVLSLAGGLKAGAVYSVTAYSAGSDSVRICGEMALPVLPSNRKELVASPNPATTHITVSHPDLGKETTIVGIYSAGGGSLVLSYLVEAGNGNSVQIDISGLAAGSYVVRVLGTTKMIVKQ
jgi:hypothetical protein